MGGGAAGGTDGKISHRGLFSVGFKPKWLAVWEHNGAKLWQKQWLTFPFSLTICFGLFFFLNVVMKRTQCYSGAWYKLHKQEDWLFFYLCQQVCFQKSISLSFPLIAGSSSQTSFKTFFCLVSLSLAVGSHLLKCSIIKEPFYNHLEIFIWDPGLQWSNLALLAPWRPYDMGQSDTLTLCCCCLSVKDKSGVGTVRSSERVPFSVSLYERQRHMQVEGFGI